MALTKILLNKHTHHHFNIKLMCRFWITYEIKLEPLYLLHMGFK